MKQCWKKIVLFMTLFLGLSPVAFAAVPVQTTIEGQGHFFTTGESYPTNIQIAGYNSRDRELTLNCSLETTKTVDTGKKASFQYVIEVFNESSVLLGNDGTLSVPLTLEGAEASKTAEAKNHAFILGSPLTSEYRIVVSVQSVTIN